MIQQFSFICRAIVAWPLVVIGYVLTDIAAWFIKTGAWLIDLETEQE